MAKFKWLTFSTFPNERLKRAVLLTMMMLLPLALIVAVGFLDPKLRKETKKVITVRNEQSRQTAMHTLT